MNVVILRRLRTDRFLRNFFFRLEYRSDHFHSKCAAFLWPWRTSQYQFQVCWLHFGNSAGAQRVRIHQNRRNFYCLGHRFLLYNDNFGENAPNVHLKCYFEVYDDIKCSRAMSQLHFGGHGVIFGHIWANLDQPIDQHFIWYYYTLDET